MDMHPRIEQRENDSAPEGNDPHRALLSSSRMTECARRAITAAIDAGTFGQPIGKTSSCEVVRIERTKREWAISRRLLGTHSERDGSRDNLIGQALDNGGVRYPDSPKIGRDIALSLGGQPVEAIGTYLDPKAPTNSRHSIDDRAWVKVTGKVIFLDISYREVLRLCGTRFFDEIHRALAEVERRGGTFKDALGVLRS